jgi:hypothetical protein
LHALRQARLDSDSERVTDAARIQRKDVPASVQAAWRKQHEYWKSLPEPNSHHIVESNVLELPGVSQRVGARDLDYPKLPAMMLSAEFHSRYFNPLLTQAREQAQRKNWRGVCEEYRLFYEGQSHSFAALWAAARIVLKAGLTQANIPATASPSYITSAPA